MLFDNIVKIKYYNFSQSSLCCEKTFFLKGTKMSVTSTFVGKLLDRADVHMNGDNPWDPQAKNPDLFFNAIANEGVLGLGESYVEGVWDCVDLVVFYHKVVQAGLYEYLMDSKPAKILQFLHQRRNLQGTKRKSEQNARDHYGQRSQIIQAMLDSRRTYTCAIWKDPENLDDEESLEEAQERKLDLICRKLGLQQGKTLLDIGCGYGSLIGYAREKYGVRALGITPVPEQVEYVQRKYGSSVEVRQADYRDVQGKFDAVVSVGMAEHVGKKNFQGFMEIHRNCLNPRGVALLHLIGFPKPAIPLPGPWMEQYIFPGVEGVSPSEILAAAEPHLSLADVQEIGYHYGKTLVHWLRRAKEPLAQMNDQRFQRRMWEHYLACCPAMFWTRRLNVCQFVFTAGDHVYQSVR